MGHHVQEQKLEENPDYFMLDRADMQEGCAMRYKPNIWSDSTSALESSGRCFVYFER